MATIFVDRQAYDVTDGQNCLQACLSLGFNLPYFCWHPALGSVGACRQCAVKQFKDEKDTHGRLVMACMTPAANGARIAIEDPEAQEFRRSVTEWLMLNHPHDCPVCDEGGECHLQDMVVMTGHAYRRYSGAKRTFRNQDLGPLVNHEMNRCIQCYRCVRFYRDYAGGRDFDAFAQRSHVYFGRHADGVLQSEFSGNLVEICPTGVFTDKTFKQHYTRKWDLQTAPSVCVHCALGCNILPAERYGELRRVRNRYHSQVNGYFLCDRGRYGYAFVNSAQRIRQPLVQYNRNGAAAPTAKADVLRRLATLLTGKVIGIGSPRASLESNFALRALVGPDRFYLGIAESEYRLTSAMVEVLRNGPARTPSLHDVEQADAVFVLGEDVTNVAPMLALALRQSVRRRPMQSAANLHIPEWDDGAMREAIQQQKGPLFIAACNRTPLDDIATGTYRAGPDDLARLGFAIAHALDPEAPAAADLPAEVRALAEQIAQSLRAAQRPLVVSGPSCGSQAVVHAAANVARALYRQNHAAELCFTLPECNSLGLALMGGQSVGAAFRAVQDGATDTVIVLENDLYRRASASTVDECLATARHIVVIDHLTSATSAKAEVVLPAATFAEADGTLVSSEGRAQRFFSVFLPEGDIQESWRWLSDMMAAAGRTEATTWQTLDGLDAALAQSLPAFKPVTVIAPPAGFRIAGQKIAREPHRYSGRTAMHAQQSVHEPQSPDDPDSALSFSMEGYHGEEQPAALIARFWAPGWNSVQAVNKFQSEIAGPLHGGDPGRRLIEPPAATGAAYFGDVPVAFAPREQEWLVVPLHHIFGSEELSVLSPGVAELSAKSYVALNAADAARLGVHDGDSLDLILAGTTQRLQLKITPALAVGVAGLPVGLPGMPWVQLPEFGKFARIAKHD